MEDTLKLKGVLDSKRFKALNNEQKEKFFVDHANEILPILVKRNWTVEPEEDAAHEYHINSEYVLIDSYYNNHGTVKGTLVWSRNAGATLLNFENTK